jgi:RHS repeat-associated protein
MVPGYIFTIYSIAVKTELIENSHQGSGGIKAGFCLAAMEADSNAAPGMPVCLWRNGIRSRSSGKERDNETGLDYFGARYYSGAQGRWTSPDPGNAGASLGDPQSWNAYAYTRNNPLKYIDPNGLWEYEVGYVGSFIGVGPGERECVIGTHSEESFLAIVLQNPDFTRVDHFDIKEDYFYKAYIGDMKQGVFILRNQIYAYKRSSEEAGLQDATFDLIMTGGMIKGGVQIGAGLIKGAVGGIRAAQLGRFLGDEAGTLTFGNISPRALALARKLGINAASPGSKAALQNLDMTVEDFIGLFRKASVKSQLPGEYLKESVESALKSGNSTVRKLLLNREYTQ